MVHRVEGRDQQAAGGGNRVLVEDRAEISNIDQRLRPVRHLEITMIVPGDVGQGELVEEGMVGRCQLQADLATFLPPPEIGRRVRPVHIGQPVRMSGGAHGDNGLAACQKVGDLFAPGAQHRRIGAAGNKQGVDAGQICFRQVARVDDLVEKVAVAWLVNGAMMVVGAGVEHCERGHCWGPFPLAQAQSCGAMRAVVSLEPTYIQRSLPACMKMRPPDGRS